MVITVVLLLIALCAFFTAAEAAYASANAHRLELTTPQTGLGGRAARWFYQRPGVWTATSLVGGRLAAIGFLTIASLYLAPILHDVATSAFGWSRSTSLIVTTAALLVILAGVLITVCELVPRTAVAGRGDRVVPAFATPMRLANILLLPLINVTAWSTRGVLQLTGVETDSIVRHLDDEIEIRSLAARYSSGFLRPDEGEVLFENVLRMGRIRVKDSMVPRTDIIAIEEGTPLDVARRMFIESGFSKLPVFRENIDRVVGIAFAHELFHGATTLLEITRHARFVPESKPSKALLREFLATNTSIAVVIDEYGGTAGLVTREDLLEELFGDIQDEFDSDDDVLEHRPDGTYLVSGRVEVETLAEQFDVRLPEGDYESLAGYLLEQIGAIPSVGDQYVLDDYRFVILKASSTRVDLVRISREPS